MDKVAIILTLTTYLFIQSQSFCVPFACSPHVSMASHPVLWFTPQLKNMHVRLTAGSKLRGGKIVSVYGCVYVSQFSLVKG